jgi:Polysaccharide lyase
MIRVASAIALLSACIVVAPSYAPAKWQSAAACGGSLTAAFKMVRPRGLVLLSGHACAQGTVVIQQRKRGKWRRIGNTTADQGGTFSACVRLRRSKTGRKVRLRALASDGTSARATVRTARREKKRGCGLRLLREDLATDPDPRPLWGTIDAVSPSRHKWFANGGPDGGPFRRMTALDGDDFDGERAEIGNGDYRLDQGKLDTFYLYRAGTHRVTSFWMRLPVGFPVSPDRERWQNVMQMKQTSPANNSSGTPVLALQATDGDWLLKQSDSPGPADDMHILWRTPARVGVWTRIVIDAVYSNDPTVGRLRITIGGVSSPVFKTYTLKTETSPPGEDLQVGEGIPSHLRMGIYHDETLPSASVDITDVQIFG